MTLTEIAAELVARCREGRETENLARLYAPDAVSVEGADMSGQGAETRGLDGIMAKHQWWESAHIIHGGAVEGPFTHQPDRFAVIFDMDVENRQTGQRVQMREVAIYTVADGRIVREEFCYPA
ncbi:MAG: SnoaL-like domain-containing protein [Gemmobacter sp.]